MFYPEIAQQDSKGQMYEFPKILCHATNICIFLNNCNCWIDSIYVTPICIQTLLKWNIPVMAQGLVTQIGLDIIVVNQI